MEEACKLTSSREILLWMTPSETPKALQAAECSGFAPKSCPKGPKVTFWSHFGHIWYPGAGFLAFLGAVVAHLGAHSGFSGISWARTPTSVESATGAETPLA